MSSLRALVIAFAVLAAPLRAFAAPVASDKPAAQALFDDGYRLMNEGKYREACVKLEESARIDPAMGTRFRLAECYEAVGRTASAWAGYVEVADLARAAGQAAREKVARERAEALRPSLAELEIVVAAGDTPGLEIRRDGAVVGPAQWGEKMPADPGSVHVIATAPGRAAWAADVVVSRGVRTAVHVPVLARVVAAPVAAPPAAPTPAAADEREADGGARRPWGIALTGVGVAGLLTGGALGLVALRNYDAAEGHCRGDVCDAQGKASTDSARDLAAIATWVCAAGGAVAVTGAVLWLTAPSPRGTRVRATPGRLLLEGAF